jgi:hypothetical protein
MEQTTEKLTPEQVSNFRKVLVDLIGPWALLLTESEIQNIRDALQKKINKIEKENQ